MKSFKEYMKKYGIRMGILVVVVALISLLAINGSVGHVSAVGNASGAMSMPVKEASSGISGWLEGVYGYMFRYDQLKAENEELKIKLSEAENKLVDYNSMKEENERLQSLLGLRDRYSDFVLEDAYIVDRGTSNWNDTMTVNKGSESGIETGMCVIDSAYSLVGLVTEVGSGWATIRTVIDSDMRVGALAGDTGNAGVLTGDYSLMIHNRAKLSYLTEEAQIFEDDSVQTSGKGGTYPRGLVIGTVDQVLSEANGQVEYATVEPAAKLKQLSQVFIIKSFEVVD